MSEYRWRAIYNNGTFLDEYREDGTPNKYYDIDRDKLIAFELYKNNKPIYRLYLEPGQTLIYRRRVIGDYTAKPLIVFYMIGWQQQVNGKNTQSVVHIVDDDDSPIICTGRWIGEPELIKQEVDSLGNSEL